MSADPREEAAFADVIARPDDDDARLAYADAIAHRDAERAELIAVQVKLAHGRREHDMPDGKSDLLDRERALLHRRGKAWASSIADPEVAAALRPRVVIGQLGLQHQAPILHVGVEVSSEA